MPSTFTSSLRFVLPATGELSNTWGTVFNAGATSLIDSSIAGSSSITMTAANYTLTSSNGVADESRSMFLVLGGTPGASYQVICPAVSKLYFVTNNTGFAQTVKTSAGSGISVPNGAKIALRCDGTDVVEALNYAGSLTLGSSLAVGSGGTGAATFTANNVLLGNGTSAFQVVAPGASGNVLTSNGTTWQSTAPVAAGVASITFGSTGLTPSTATTGAVSVAGTLVAVNGGTGQSSYTVGDLLYASTTTALSKLADVATGNALISGGVGVAPSYGKIGLTTHVSGTLAVGNGGTGLTAGTSGGVPYFSATNTLASSSALAASALVVGGGAGVAPSTITTGTGVTTALGVAVGSAGAFVTNGGALGTPSSGTVTNLTGTASININGTVGATTANTGAFTSVTSTSAAGVLTRAAATQDGVEMVGRAGGSTSLKVTLTPTTLTASRTVTLPDANINFATGLGVENGGTGTTTLTANNVIIGNGTSAVQFIAPGTNGNVLTSNGTTWTSAAAAASLLGDTDSATPFETSLGFEAGNSNTGQNNTFIGYQTGKANTTATDNVAVGHLALTTNTTISGLTAIGSQALQLNSTGNSNTALGYFALRQNTTASSNTAVGFSALTANTTGSNNTAVGESALAANSTGSQNTAFGTKALDANTAGSGNTAVGNSALGANTTGINNTAVGEGSLQTLTTGVNNIGIGVGALSTCSTGGENVAFGNNSAFNASTATNLVAIGHRALQANTTGANNTAVGRDALLANTTGASNTGVGMNSGVAVTTGIQNTFLGAQAGASGTNNLTTGSNNTIIGFNAAASSATISNEITLGNSSIATIRAQVTTITALSDARDKTEIAPLSAGLAFTNALKPVSFTWNMRDGGKVGIPDTGFIAQDLKVVQEQTGVNIPGLVYESNPDRLEAGYGKLLPVLVKAIQELSIEVESLKAQLKGN